MRFLPVRDDALLIELDDLPATLALFDSLSSDPITGTGELIPGARTLLVSYRPSAVTPAQIVRAVRSRDLDDRIDGEGTLTAIDGSTIRVSAESICVHGDSPGATEMAAHVRRALTAASINIVAFAPRAGGGRAS